MKKFIANILTILVVGISTLHLGHAQETFSSFYSNGYYQFKGLTKYYQDNFFVDHRTDLNLTTDDDIIQMGCYIDSLGKFHCRYKQSYKGYPVEGQTFTLHGENGVVLTASGSLAQNLNIDVSSPISEATAISNALSEVNGISYRWDDTLEEAQLKDMLEDTLATHYPKGELVIAEIRNSSNNEIEFKFAWRIPIDAVVLLDSATLADTSIMNHSDDTAAMNHFVVYVDATSGDILRKIENKYSGSYGTATGLTYWDGWQYMRTWKCDACLDWRLRGDYGLMNATTSRNSQDIQTHWYTKQKPLDRDNNWDGTNSEEVLGSVTVHWELQKAFEYFHHRHGVWGSDNNGMVLLAYTHRPTSFTKKFAHFSETFGKDAIYTNEFINGNYSSDIDVMGHEYTHAFIYRNPMLNRTFNYPESGALNEGFADIFGSLIKRRQRGYMNYRNGEGINYPDPAVRYYDDPHNSNTINPYNQTSWNHEHGQPAKFGETDYWDANWTDIHINAGVLTHWFYLLANGGTYNGTSVTSIGIDAADDVTFVTMMWYLWGSSNYTDVRNQSLEVAKSWWGVCSPQYISVNRAWKAVNVGALVNCKYYRLQTSTAVAHPGDLATAKPYFKVISTDGEEATNVSYSWTLPANWSGTYSNSNSEFELSDVDEDFNSKEIKVIVTYTDAGATVQHDTLSAVLHFNDESQNKQSSSITANGNTSTKVKIYPNPTDGKFVNIELPDNSTTVVSIFSVDGIKYKDVILNAKRASINLEGTPSGVYILKIANKQYQTVERLILK